MPYHKQNQKIILHKFAARIVLMKNITGSQVTKNKKLTYQAETRTCFKKLDDTEGHRYKRECITQTD